MADQHVYVFIHLPKTGGTTVTGHLSQHLTEQELLFIGPGATKDRLERGIPDPAEWPEERRAEIRVIVGHGADAGSHRLVPNCTPRYLTIVRDPAPLMVSRFNWDMSRGRVRVAFNEWHADQRPNPTFRRIKRMLGAGDRKAVESALREFWFVAVTEHLNDDLPHIFGAIGVPRTWSNRRVAGAGSDVADLKLPGAGEAVPINRHVELTDEIRELVRTDHAADVRLHRLALELRAERREALGFEGPQGS